MKKIFLENLPRGGGNRGKNSINWEKSMGYQVNFIYDDTEGELEIIDYIKEKNDSKLKIKYNNKIDCMSSRQLMHCGLGKILGKVTSEYKFEINQNIVNNVRNLTIIDRKIKTRYKKDGSKCNDKYYEIECNKCGSINWFQESYLLGKSKSISCCKTVQKAVLGINTIWDTDKWMIPYVGEEVAKNYTRCSPHRVHSICPDCGRISNKTINIYNIYTHKSVACSCSDNERFPNKFGFNILEQLLGKNNFKREYSPKWIKPKKYDFYFELNNKKYVVEMDGGFHFKDNSKSGQTADESKAIDDYKDKQAELHGVEVIRIDCDYNSINNRFEYIKNNILNSDKLNNIFTLSYVDWNKISEFALSNLVKIACEHKRNNSELTTTQIGKLMGGYSKGCIRSWLMQGKELAWCDYDGQKEKNRGGQISAPSKFKSIICLNNNMTFNSIKECAENSEKIFGIKLLTSCISAVCRGKQKSTQGYEFQFNLKAVLKK